MNYGKQAHINALKLHTKEAIKCLNDKDNNALIIHKACIVDAAGILNELYGMAYEDLVKIMHTASNDYNKEVD